MNMGFLGLSSTLVPWELCRFDEGDRRIEVSVDKETVENGPRVGRAEWISWAGEHRT